MRARTVRSSSRYGVAAVPDDARAVPASPIRATARRAAASSSCRYRSAATHRDSRHARRVTCGVTLGLPSRSPPIQEPKRIGAASIGQAAARARAQGAVDAAHVSWQRVPEALLEHDEAAAHFVDRRGPLLAHIARLPGRRDLAAERGRPVPRAPGPSGRGDPASASAAAMRLCFWTSVRRATSVGCAVSTSSMRRPHNRLVQAIRGDAGREQTAENRPRTIPVAAAPADRADTPVAGECGDAARRCWRGGGSA